MKSEVRSHRRRTVLAVAVALSLLVAAFPISAVEPVVEGYGLDLDAFFDVSIEDCPTCTGAELDDLGRGLRLLLSRFREEAVNPFAEICVAEAALAREMGVLTFSLVRDGTIGLGRWRDYLRARAKIAGGLSQIAKEEMLRAYVERVSAQSGFEISPGSVAGQALKIYGAAQLSRVFEQMRLGEWRRGLWADALRAPGHGRFDEIVNDLLEISSSSSRSAHLDVAILDSRPQDAWTDLELAHLASLPAAFEVGQIPLLRDQILMAYQEAVRQRTWSAFHFFDGTCGVEAQFGWEDKANELAERFLFMPIPPDGSKRRVLYYECGETSYGTTVWCPIVIDEEVEVTAAPWDFVPRSDPGPEPAPPREEVGPAGPWNRGEERPWEQACRNWRQSVLGARAACREPPNDSCVVDEVMRRALDQNCNGGPYGPPSCIVEPWLGNTENGCSAIDTLCRFFCKDSGPDIEGFDLNNWVPVVEVKKCVCGENG